MSKILISWIAAKNDFLESTKGVNPAGPNATVHEHLFDGYDSHVLLTSAPDTMHDTGYQHFVSYLRKTYHHTIIPKALNLPAGDILDVAKITARISELLYREYRHDEIDIFISPGTPAMQVAWYLAYLNLGLAIRLFQTAPARKGKEDYPEKMWVTLEQSQYIHSLFIKESINDAVNSHPERFITSTLKPIYDRAKRIASANVSVLITGETGTGKELLARYIHDNSERSKENFVAVNCSSLGNELLESRLFGYEKGAFTGALQTTKGFFHEANNGTLFLDEIGDITPFMQQSLLRVLSMKEVLRVGKTEPEPVNVRIIAATNKNLYEKSVKGEFRDDLYYRLATIELRLPSIREYTARDKEKLFNHLWLNATREFKNKKAPKLPASIRKTLLEYSYYGNIREMENIILGLWAETETEVKESNIPARISLPVASNSLKLQDAMQRHIQTVYNNCNENVTRTALALEISEGTLRKKLRMP